MFQEITFSFFISFCLLSKNKLLDIQKSKQAAPLCILPGGDYPAKAESYHKKHGIRLLKLLKFYAAVKEL
jgi:hypothetical protein